MSQTIVQEPCRRRPRRQITFVPEVTFIRATRLAEGDIYWEHGGRWLATEVAHDQPSPTAADGDTRTTWTATWLGQGQDPGAGWHSYSSAGNSLRHIARESGEDVPMTTTTRPITTRAT